RDGRICAAGCEASTRTIVVAREIVLPPPYQDGPAGDHSSEVTPFTRWLRSGAATFLVGSAASSTHLAALALVGCLASFFCLCNAWRSHRAIRLWPLSHSA